MSSKPVTQYKKGLRKLTSKIKIMIVEDERIAAETVKRILKELEYSISSIEISGEDAVKKAEEDKPDLVLMDIELKGKMDGIEAAAIIRSRFDIPCIFVTAHADDKKLEQAKITEPFGYILKPFENKGLHCNIEIAICKDKAEKDRKKLIQELQDSLDKVKQLKGIVPICSNCKDIRDGEGNW
ncbi:MAG: response regulator, partial [Candidatus Pacebacteria bacterium]|nr:response regulator [Candidatus Paceibacterota bacterium]